MKKQARTPMVTLTIRLPKEMLENITRLAEQRGDTTSVLARRGIYAEYERVKKGVANDG